MTELGALLELIHDAHSRLTTFEAEYRDWNRPPATMELHVVRSELGDVQTHWRGAGPFPKASVNARRIWLRAPSNLRVEIEAGHQLVRIGVLNSERWWRWDRESGPVWAELVGETRAVIPPPPLLRPPLVEPASLFGVLRFEVVGSAVVAGREVMSARAMPRRVDPTSRVLRYEFDFDAQHGTVLRRAVRHHGQIVSVTEATAVAYGASIDEERFVFTSPDGQPSHQIRL